MERKIIITADGSHSIFIPGLDEHYHSVHGAVQESRHVFIEAGLKFISERKREVSILEMGLGTGLNVFLTFLEAKEIKINYTALEAFPISPGQAEALNYPRLLDAEAYRPVLQILHTMEPGKEVELRPGFIFRKEITKFGDFRSREQFDLIYFDAFAPRVQPELWTEEIFGRMFGSLRPGGILVTYCAKGEVKRNMKAAGFTIERLPGPKGKREMTRALKV
ncbi:MAG TPA: tRNA (5-methylaminomethyl-2-thiouridine)(34)-methyltransferase MnmD [Bacteroidia bacterium]|jgi:tRNA U34 5-methylaminomethyl-2-thiouridine-forming methyltransferase MnmC